MANTSLFVLSLSLDKKRKKNKIVDFGQKNGRFKKEIGKWTVKEYKRIGQIKERVKFPSQNKKFSFLSM